MRRRATTVRLVASIRSVKDRCHASRTIQFAAVWLRALQVSSNLAALENISPNVIVSIKRLGH
jgi:hypothetical protein